MSTKIVNLIGRQFEIEGVGPDDSYFLGLGDGTDMDFTTVVRNFLPSNSIALDIGANIGITSCILGQQLTEGRVYSYEPSPSVFPVLSRNISRNGLSNVTISQNAVGATKGTLGFAGLSAYGHLVNINEDNKKTSEVIVNVISVDDIVSSLALDRIDFIKIDVEGFENDVLTGGQITEINHSPLYYMEFNSFCISAYGRLNPFELAERVIREFKFVYLVGIDGTLRGPIIDPVMLVHTNIVEQGSVSNLLMTNSSKRLKILSLERDRVLAKRNHARRNPWKYLFSPM